MKYYLMAHNKDAGYDTALLVMKERASDRPGEILNKLRQIAALLKEDMEKDRLVDPENGEPFDWLFIMDEQEDTWSI